jgi:thiol-disulfide isomerase/thioredoxin
MARFINFNSNSLPPLNNESTSILSRAMSAGSNMSTNPMLLIGALILFGIVAFFIYYYYISPSMTTKYHPNSEQVPTGNSNGKTAELLFFYADWCPHCKAAKPIMNEIAAEYENKTINGYKLIYTPIDCSEETAEVEKLMNQYTIEGYPTIKLLKDGQIIEYDAKPSKEMLIKFLNTVL